MDARKFDQRTKRCFGVSDRSQEQHAKGCKNRFPLRWHPSSDHLFTVECANATTKFNRKEMIRLIPTPGVWRL